MGRFQFDRSIHLWQWSPAVWQFGYYWLESVKEAMLLFLNCFRSCWTGSTCATSKVPEIVNSFYFFQNLATVDVGLCTSYFTVFFPIESMLCMASLLKMIHCQLSAIICQSVCFLFSLIIKLHHITADIWRVLRQTLFVCRDLGPRSQGLQCQFCACAL